MKITDIITEKRRNADHPSQQKEFLEKYLASLPSLDGIYLHYTNINKVGINPKSNWYETPRGIYAYRARYGAYGEVHVPWKPGHARHTKYVFVLKLKPNARILNFGTYTLKQFKNDLEILGKEWDKKYKEYSQENIAHVIYNVIYTASHHRSTRLGWRTVFHKLLGYDGLEDPGYGLIHKNERHQIVFFHRGAFDILKQLYDYPFDQKYKNFAYSMNPNQIEEQIAKGNWFVITRINTGDKINLSPENQIKLLKVNTRGVNKNHIRKAIKAILNPTDEFHKAVVDQGDSYLIADTASNNIKRYILSKNPTSIIGMKNPPKESLEILTKTVGPKDAKILINLNLT